MVSGEDREAKAAQWLQRLQEAAALKESLVDYCRRRGFKLGEAYQWKRNLRSAGRWPEVSSEAANTNRSAVVAGTASPRFARVRILVNEQNVLFDWTFFGALLSAGLYVLKRTFSVD